MKETERKFLNNNRQDFSKISGSLELPYLVEIQTNSFEWFKKEGVNQVFKEFFPLENYRGDIRLKFEGAHFGEMTGYKICKQCYDDIFYPHSLQSNQKGGICKASCCKYCITRARKCACVTCYGGLSELVVQDRGNIRKIESIEIDRIFIIILRDKIT